MTDQELTGIARQTLNMARTDVELGGWKTSILVAVYNVTDRPPLHRMRVIEDFLQAKLGERWLSSGRGKDVGFGILRLAVTAAVEIKPDAVAICTPTNYFKPTKKWDAMTKKQKLRLADRAQKGGHDEQHRMTAEGLFEIMDSFTAIVQTPERVCSCAQPVRRGAFIGEPIIHYFPQAQFDGRLKMYGVEMDEEEKQFVAEFREKFYGQSA